MKRKHVIATFALSALLGVGVFAGLHAHEIKEAKAATKTIYCRVTKSWWTAGGAAVGVYYWDANGNNGYPGARMTAVPGETGLWSYDFPTDYSNLIFTRMNPSDDGGQDWGAKTANLTLPADKNLYTITSDSPVWGDPGAAGEWGNYVPEAPKYTVNIVVDGVAQASQQVTEGALPVEPSAGFGKTFSGWFDDVNCSEGHEVTSITAATTVYGKMLDKETATFGLDLSRVTSIFTGTLNIYAWDANGHNADWPGVAIANNSAITIPADADFIINNGNGVGKVQTVDIETVKNDDTLIIKAFKDDADKYKTKWLSEFDEPAEDGYYIVGTETNWKYAGATKMGAGEGTDKAYLRYNGKANEEFKVRSFFNDVDTWVSPTNYEVGESAKVLDIYVNKDDEVYISEYVEPDVPAEEGYYICGLDGWKYTGATKMVAPSTVPGNVAHYMDLEVEVNDEIRVRSYYNDRDPKDQWATVGQDGSDAEHTADFGEKSGNNFKFTKAGHYDVYAKYESEVFKFYIAEHVNSYTITMTGVNFNGKAPAGTVNLADQTAYASSNFEAQMPAQNGYVARGVYENEACTTAYTPKEFNAAGHLYVKYTKIGAYMVGEDTFEGQDLGWTIDGATYLTSDVNDTENNLYEGSITITGASVQDPVEVRPVLYTAGGELDYPTYTMGASYEFASKVGNNIHFSENGTYAVYYTKSNQIWLNKGAEAFYTKFLTEVGAICDADGHTNTENLTSVWSAQEDAFNSLSKSERDAIKAVGFDGGDEHGSNLEKVIAKYHYIVTKYGTTIAKDFIWGETINPTNYNARVINMDDSTMLVVVISSVTIISAAGLFFLIRRKRHLVK